MSNFHIVNGVEHKQQQLASWRREAATQRQVKHVAESMTEENEDDSQTAIVPSQRATVLLKQLAIGLKLWTIS